MKLYAKKTHFIIADWWPKHSRPWNHANWDTMIPTARTNLVPENKSPNYQPKSFQKLTQPQSYQMLMPSISDKWYQLRILCDIFDRIPNCVNMDQSPETHDIIWLKPYFTNADWWPKHSRPWEHAICDTMTSNCENIRWHCWPITQLLSSTLIGDQNTHSRPWDHTICDTMAFNCENIIWLATPQLDIGYSWIMNLVSQQCTWPI